MRENTKKTRLKASLLLTLYLVVLLASALHVHSNESEQVCQDCLSHVKHEGHLVQASLLETNCVFCNVFHASYITPQVIVLLAAVLVGVACMVNPVQDLVRRAVSLPSLRAPPVMCC